MSDDLTAKAKALLERLSDCGLEAADRAIAAKHDFAKDQAVRSLYRSSVAYAALLDALTRRRLKGQRKILVEYQHFSMRKMQVLEGKSVQRKINPSRLTPIESREGEALPGSELPNGATV